MIRTNKEKSDRSKDSIYESNDRLCLEYETKSRSHFFCYYSPFDIEESKIPILYLCEKLLDAKTIDNKYIRKNESNEKLCKNNSRIGDVCKGLLSDRLEVIRIDDISDHIFESKIETHTCFDFFYKILSLVSNIS